MPKDRHSTRPAARPIAGVEFSRGDIETAARGARLLSMEVEMTHACNLHCGYCYASAGNPLAGELSLSEIVNAVEQAAGLGARKIVILGGGEPCMYKDLHVLIERLRGMRLDVELFTNATLIDGSRAAFLHGHGVSVVAKRNSLVKSVQDELAGVPGAFERIEKGFAALMEAGYPDETHGLGIQTIICRQNLGEMADLWRWARDRGIQPYFECLTVQGRLNENMSLNVSPEETRQIFLELCRIDREAYGISWMPHPPLVSSRCARHLYSILLKANGDFHPCVGVEISLGNVRLDRLADIVSGHPVLSDMRNIYDRIKGRCRDCQFNGECYGCRGNAFQLTGDHLASDPSCWLNGDYKARAEAGR
jgi:radical SAM protein with 4Fe4S-binding SPASM domain